MNQQLNLLDFYQKFKDEDTCKDYLAQMRWGDSITCPHCSSTKIYRFSTRKLYKCGTCRKQFTVRVGTIFEDSKLPLQKWFLAIYLATSLKKGVSSVQLSKYLGITQKASWFMLHRIRYAIQSGTFIKPMGGIVEADETYVGGVRRGKRGRGAEHKTAVVGVAERHGNVAVSTTVDTKSPYCLQTHSSKCENWSDRYYR